MPEVTRAQAQAALNRYNEFDHTPVAPQIWIERTGNHRGWVFKCPYPKEDEEIWHASLFQVFGTRSTRTMDHFLNSLTELVGDNQWDEASQRWIVREDAFQAALNIIYSLDPQNEAQAAYAAQLVALHLSSMKLGAQCSKSYADPRTSAILAKTVKAYGDGLERMARLQGKIEAKQVNQTITVVYADNRSVHINGGVSQNGGQAQGTAGGATIQSPALPSPSSINRQSMPVAGSEGEAGLSHPWWGQRLWSALRRT